MSDSLAGRVALVTGASSGLGRAIALALAAAGVDVAVNSRASAEGARSVAREAEALGVRTCVVQADVADPNDVVRMAAEVRAALGRVDLLVNNAGTTVPIPATQLERYTAADWDRVLRTNVTGAFICVQALVDDLRASGVGCVVNVASNSAVTGRGSSLPYVVSKGALATLTLALARALHPAVRVNAVAPGWMETPWLDRNIDAQVVSAVRAGGEPMVAIEEVAQTVLHLAATPSINGQMIVLDGGAGLA